MKEGGIYSRLFSCRRVSFSMPQCPFSHAVMFLLPYRSVSFSCRRFPFAAWRVPVRASALVLRSLFPPRFPCVCAQTVMLHHFRCSCFCLPEIGKVACLERQRLSPCLRFCLAGYGIGEARNRSDFGTVAKYFVNFTGKGAIRNSESRPLPVLFPIYEQEKGAFSAMSV